MVNEIFGNTTTTPINPNLFSGGGGGNGSNVNVDQAFDPKSENAQSGIAVAEAVEDKVTVHKGTEISISSTMIVKKILSTPEQYPFKVGDLYLNTDEEKTYQFIDVFYDGENYNYTYIRFGNSGTVDQIYNPISENAQSGIAVAAAVEQAMGEFDNGVLASTIIDDILILEQTKNKFNVSVEDDVLILN